LEAGADDFLIKPFRTKEILLRASALVRTRELHDSLLLQNQRVHGQGRDLEKRVLDQEFQLAQLKKFFSPKVAELVSVSTDQGLKTSHRKELTLLFTDLRGFTSFTERAGPGEVIQVLHEYYSLIGNHALEHQGTLGRFLGDGMMVYFNDPNEVANHQRVAMNTALAMRESLLRLREKWLESRYELDVGIGIATGIETVGLIGFDKCQDYSIIGTATNFASRLCAEAKGGQILVSDTFFKVHLAQDFNSEFLGEVSFKGIQAPVKIHNITGSKVAQEMHPA
jgi:adenylate cyclase